MIYEDFLNALKAMIDEQARNFNGDRTTGYNPGCNDIPGGFQELDPVLFTMIGEVVGVVISNQIPINVQNAIGNWFELVGQVLLTYSAQQQYFQAGPGRYYDVRNKNITNPFCPSASDQGAGATPSSGTENEEAKDNSGNCQMENLQKNIMDLMVEVECLKEEIRNLKESRNY